MFMSTENLQADTFLATDRCDRCGAQAQARVELVSGDLLFCLHHFRQHRAVLETVSVFPPTFAF